MNNTALRLITLTTLELFTVVAWARPAPGSDVPPLPDLIKQVRGSIVDIVVKVYDFDRAMQARLVQATGCPFNDRGECVVGTGFFVNDQGDLVTASHVDDALKTILQKLDAMHMDADATLNFEYPNSEPMHGNQAIVLVKPLASDKVHDIAILEAEQEGYNAAKQSRFSPGVNLTLKSVTLDPTRHQDGDDVFACGYPLGAEELVTTSGHIASAWGQENLLTARKNGFFQKSDVYKLDLRINPGNSGGPVFDSKTQTVIGMTVEVANNSIAIAVPSRYIIDFLNTKRVSWNPFRTSDTARKHK